MRHVGLLLDKLFPGRTHKLTPKERRRQRRLAALGAMVAAALVIGLGIVIVDRQNQHEPGFHAGYLISDRDFFNGDALDASGVQAFLNEKQQDCEPDAGERPCLRHFIMDLPDYPESTRCERIDAVPGASAALIIARVGKACNISQEVLLVLLEKEQSLVSNLTPEAHRYDRATGYSCPDDPARPGRCHPDYAGFANQVYHAADQFQLYKERPHKFNVQAGRVNHIAYQANAPECGEAEVFIENQATAGLYNYTPYVPNEAALNPANPDGDSCSAFGNRNFWLFYESWFGDPKNLGPWEPVE